MIPNLQLLPDERFYPVLHEHLTQARRRVYVSMFLFSPRWYDKTINLMADFTAASQRGLQCRMVLSAAPIKIDSGAPTRRRPSACVTPAGRSRSWPAIAPSMRS